MSTSFTIGLGNATLAGVRAGTGKAVVFLHAGVADKRMWAAQLADLGQEYLTIAYDRRGFGETVTPDEPFSNVEDLRQLLDELGIASAVLVGCSQGGRIAIDFTLAYPERAEALVLIASAISGAPPPGDLEPDVEALVDELDNAEEAGDLNRVNEMEAILWLDGPTSPVGRVSGAARDLFLDMNGIALAHPELTQEIEPPSAYGRLDQLTIPVLVLWGDLDLAHMYDRAQALVTSIPDARGVEIPGTAHLPNLEQPETINTLISDFLKEVT
ncbi:MAG: alpha/beta hydrolase [Chloroflexota bacterium]